MSVNAGNIDVVVDTGDLNVPHCAHGPTLLFSRFHHASGSERKFFACSAFRDRKACPFFQWTDVAHGSQLGQDRRCLRVPELWPTLCHKEMRKRFQKFKKLAVSSRQMCVECGLLLLPGETSQHVGQGHILRSEVTDEMLDKSSELFTPLEDNKTFAQYLFSKKSVDFVVDQLSELGVTHVLSIGCPRIHEALLHLSKKKDGVKIDSLLLDLDHRFLQVNAPGKFCRYNMLNHHFFGGEPDKTTYNNFLRRDSGKHVAMVIDPPFGIMVEALCATVKKIQEEWRSSCKDGDGGTDASIPVLWFFRYFLEQRVTDTDSSFVMLDYKVDYDNHDLFRTEKGRKKGSPVRIFTNIKPDRITLPSDDGYWYCKVCSRYCSSENQHCKICNQCTTKDGPTYRHCNKCNRCVKPSRVHCDTCDHCDLPSHKCNTAKTKGCHVCGDVGHKRRECPQRNAADDTGTKTPRQGKRASEEQTKKQTGGKKKRRK